MANALKGEASFPLGGETLTLRFDAEALLEAEDALGVGVFAILGGLDSLKFLAELLRAGLRSGCGRELDRKQAAEMLLEHPQAGAAIVKALGLAMPEPEAAPEQEAGAGATADPPLPPRRKRGTGTRS